MKLLLLLSALGLTGASPLGDDRVCRPHSRPWHVSLRGGGSSCSGALIHEQWIVTSFECAITPYSTAAHLGDHDVTVDEDTEQRIYVADVVQRGPYRSPLHSLTMVRLAEPARLTASVRPVALPSRCPQPGQTCHVSGWGSTTPNQYDPRLKCLSVPVVDDQTCMNSFPEWLFWSPFMICAGRANTDNCLSGHSNVMVCDGELQGLLWFNHGCENPFHPSVYTKMCLYNNWIKDVMDNYVPTLPTETTPVTVT